MRDLIQLSLAPSTRRSYSSGQRRFFQFCTTVGLLHQSGSPFPVSESTLELFVSYLSSTVSYRTVKCYLAAVRSLQIELGLGDPLTLTPCLEHFLRRIKRSQASTAHARPSRLLVTRDLMLLFHSRLNLADPDGAMLRAAFSTAWFGFLRVSKFTTPPSSFDPSVHLSISDLAVNCHLRTSGVFLLIKASKTDPFRLGVRLFLPPTGGVLCSVASLSAYLHRRGSLSGPLFLFTDGKTHSRLLVTARLRSILA